MAKPSLENLRRLSQTSTIRTAKGGEKQNDLIHTSLYITPELRRALKLRMIDENRDMSSIIRDAITLYLRSGSGLLEQSTRSDG